MPTQNFLNKPLILMNLYQHVKNEAVSSISLGDMADIKMLESDCLKALWPISKKPDFSQLWDLCKNTASNTFFHSEQIKKKLMTKFFKNFKKPYFGPIYNKKSIMIRLQQNARMERRTGSIS